MRILFAHRGRGQLSPSKPSVARGLMGAEGMIGLLVVLVETGFVRVLVAAAVVV